MSYDDTNQIILSKVTSTNPNAPYARVLFNIDGVKYKAGLWLWKRQDDSPVTDKDGNRKYKGKVEVYNYQPQEAGDKPPTDDGFTDDDIPF